jgi:hypothetical protein
MIASESEPHPRTHTTKRLARRACPRPPVLTRVAFMRDARAHAAGHRTLLNSQHWLLCHTGKAFSEETHSLRNPALVAKKMK